MQALDMKGDSVAYMYVQLLSHGHRRKPLHKIKCKAIWASDGCEWTRGPWG